MRGRILPFVALVGLASSCGTGSSSFQHVQLAHLGFDVPNDWHNHNMTQRGVVTSVWTPEENDRKESVTVIRTERSPAVANAGLATLEDILTRAQIPGARVSSTKLLTTTQGLHGVRIDADYIPPGLKATYHRVHVVLIDDESLVHVFYTAVSPDAALATFNLVLSSIHEES